MARIPTNWRHKVSLTPDELREAMIGWADHFEANQEKLGALDAVAGDGDLGITLSRGFAAVAAELTDTASADIGALFTTAGTVLLRKAPSTMGTLLGAAFRSAGEGVAGEAFLTGEALLRVIDRCAASIAGRGRVSAGDRSVLDAIIGSVEALQGLPGDVGIADALQAATSGAEEAAARTAQMEPRVGRARWIGDRAKGSPDAGAVAWAELMLSLADYVETR